MKLRHFLVEYQVQIFHNKEEKKGGGSKEPNKKTQVDSEKKAVREENERGGIDRENSTVERRTKVRSCCKL